MAGCGFPGTYLVKTVYQDQDSWGSKCRKATKSEQLPEVLLSSPQPRPLGFLAAGNKNPSALRPSVYVVWAALPQCTHTSSLNTRRPLKVPEQTPYLLSTGQGEQKLPGGLSFLPLNCKIIALWVGGGRNCQEGFLFRL